MALIFRLRIYNQLYTQMLELLWSLNSSRAYKSLGPPWGMPSGARISKFSEIDWDISVAYLWKWYSFYGDLQVNAIICPYMYNTFFHRWCFLSCLSMFTPIPPILLGHMFQMGWRLNYMIYDRGWIPIACRQFCFLPHDSWESLNQRLGRAGGKRSAFGRGGCGEIQGEHVPSRWTSWKKRYMEPQKWRFL